MPELNEPRDVWYEYIRKRYFLIEYKHEEGVQFYVK
jgi:hypothetical protein